jgi:hypothetical protein
VIRGWRENKSWGNKFAKQKKEAGACAKSAAKSIEKSSGRQVKK